MFVSRSASSKFWTVLSLTATILLTSTKADGDAVFECQRNETCHHDICNLVAGICAVDEICDQLREHPFYSCHVENSDQVLDSCDECGDGAECHVKQDDIWCLCHGIGIDYGVDCVVEDIRPANHGESHVEPASTVCEDNTCHGEGSICVVEMGTALCKCNDDGRVVLPSEHCDGTLDDGSDNPSLRKLVDAEGNTKFRELNRKKGGNEALLRGEVDAKRVKSKNTSHKEERHVIPGLRKESKKEEEIRPRGRDLRALMSRRFKELTHLPQRERRLTEHTELTNEMGQKFKTKKFKAKTVEHRVRLSNAGPGRRRLSDEVENLDDIESMIESVECLAGEAASSVSVKFTKALDPDAMHWLFPVGSTLVVDASVFGECNLGASVKGLTFSKELLLRHSDIDGFLVVKSVRSSEDGFSVLISGKASTWYSQFEHYQLHMDAIKDGYRYENDGRRLEGNTCIEEEGPADKKFVFGTSDRESLLGQWATFKQNEGCDYLSEMSFFENADIGDFCKGFMTFDFDFCVNVKDTGLDSIRIEWDIWNPLDVTFHVDTVVDVLAEATFTLSFLQAWEDDGESGLEISNSRPIMEKFLGSIPEPYNAAANTVDEVVGGMEVPGSSLGAYFILEFVVEGSHRLNQDMRYWLTVGYETGRKKTRHTISTSGASERVLEEVEGRGPFYNVGHSDDTFLELYDELFIGFQPAFGLLSRTLAVVLSLQVGVNAELLYVGSGVTPLPPAGGWSNSECRQNHRFEIGLDFEVRNLVVAIEIYVDVIKFLEEDDVNEDWEIEIIRSIVDVDLMTLCTAVTLDEGAEIEAFKALTPNNIPALSKAEYLLSLKYEPRVLRSGKLMNANANGCVAAHCPDQSFECVQVEGGFSISWAGDCSIFAPGQLYHEFCDDVNNDYVMFSAQTPTGTRNVKPYEACAECGRCRLPECVQVAGGFSISWAGDCSSFAPGRSNHEFCDDGAYNDYAMFSAETPTGTRMVKPYEACPECGRCGSIFETCPGSITLRMEPCLPTNQDANQVFEWLDAANLRHRKSRRCVQFPTNHEQSILELVKCEQDEPTYNADEEVEWNAVTNQRFDIRDSQIATLEGQDACFDGREFSNWAGNCASFRIGQPNHAYCANNDYIMAWEEDGQWHSIYPYEACEECGSCHANPSYDLNPMNGGYVNIVAKTNTRLTMDLKGKQGVIKEGFLPDVVISDRDNEDKMMLDDNEFMFVNSHVKVFQGHLESKDYTGKCLYDAGGLFVKNIGDCWYGYPHFQWTMFADGTLMNVYTGRFLDLNGDADSYPKGYVKHPNKCTRGQNIPGGHLTRSVQACADLCDAYGSGCLGFEWFKTLISGLHDCYLNNGIDTSNCDGSPSGYNSDFYEKDASNNNIYTIHIKADRYPHEITWNLEYDDGSVRQQVFELPINDYDEVIQTIDAAYQSRDDECWTFNIFDSAGDGICCGYGKGWYKIFRGSTLIHEGGSYGRTDSFRFGTACDGLSMRQRGPLFEESKSPWMLVKQKEDTRDLTSVIPTDSFLLKTDGPVVDGETPGLNQCLQLDQQGNLRMTTCNQNAHGQRFHFTMTDCSRELLFDEASCSDAASRQNKNFVSMPTGTTGPFGCYMNIDIEDAKVGRDTGTSIAWRGISPNLVWSEDKKAVEYAKDTSPENPQTFRTGDMHCEREMTNEGLIVGKFGGAATFELESCLTNTNSTALHFQRCHGGYEQVFAFYQSSGELVHLHSGLCVFAIDQNNLSLEKCNTNNNPQGLWDERNGHSSGGVRFRNRKYGGSTQNGYLYRGNDGRAILGSESQSEFFFYQHACYCFTQSCCTSTAQTFGLGSSYSMNDVAQPRGCFLKKSTGNVYWNSEGLSTSDLAAVETRLMSHDEVRVRPLKQQLSNGDIKSIRGDYFKVEIQPDRFAGEMSWDIKDRNDDIQVEQSRNLRSGDLTKYVYELQGHDCWTFTIEDSWGDGICCGYGIGYYKIYRGGDVIYEGGSYGSSETKTFGNACDGASEAGTGMFRVCEA